MLRPRASAAALPSENNSLPLVEPLPAKKKKRLAFVIAHLGPGGAQRVAVNAANALVERGFDVHVTILGHQPIVYRVDPRIVFHSSSPVKVAFPAPASGPADVEADQLASATDDFDEPIERVGLLATYVKPYLPPRVLALGLKVAGPVFSLIWQSRRTLWLRRTLRKIEPDAVLSFLTQTNILTVLATRGLDTHTVISERNDPRLQRHRARVERLRHIVYPWADVVTANSKGALTALKSFVPKHKLAFLPNPLAAAPTNEAVAFTAPTVITVGRLVEQKGIDVLIAAWAKVAAALPNWRLALVGGGPLVGALKAQARKLDIDDSIDWIGHVSDPFPLLRGAKVFVMTSRFEGTPNALLEAMACGLPAVVSDASPGPCELVGTGDDASGMIVPVEDAGATAEAIIRLARDETLRRRFGLAARERARAHDANHAIDVWLRLLRCEQEQVRIVFVIPSLGAGGAERVASLLANEWSSHGHDVTVATFDNPGTEPFFALNPNVSLRELAAPADPRGVWGKLGTNFARVSRLRSLLRELHPDVIVAFMTEANVIALWASQGLGIPIVISERNQPDRPGLGTIHRLARRLTYPKASAIVVQTDAIASWTEARFRIPVHVLPNPVRLDAGEARREPGEVQWLVSLGRLTQQKGFDVLIRSFAALANKHPSWRLAIYGEGPDRSYLERLRAESGCEERIVLPGLVKDSAEALGKASLFVLPSRFEGYPNALLEALACGLPVIATSAPGGSVEILANGVYGMLVLPDDIAAMTTALDAMLSTPELRDAYAWKSRRAVAKLDITVMGGRWLDLLAALKG